MKQAYLLACLFLVATFCYGKGKEVVTTAPVAGPVVGTAEWRDAVKSAQDLNKQGKYQEAVDAAPLSYQKAWYALSVLRQMMGGTRGASGNWGGYNVEYQTDPKEGKFAGSADEREACINQIVDIRDLIKQATDEGYSKNVDGIEEYLVKYEKGILR